MGEKDQNGAGGGDGGGAKSITVGEKTYGAAEITALVEAQAKGTQALQSLAPVMQMAEKYGLEGVDGVISQAEASTRAISRLIDEGVIDDEGKVIAPQKKSPSGDNDVLSALLGNKESGNAGGTQLSKTDEAVAKALGGIKSQTESAQNKIKELEATQASLTRHILKGEIQKVHPDLDDDDVSRIMGAAQSTGKGVMDVAAAFSKTQEGKNKTAEEAWAKKYGVDIEAWEKFNAQKDQDPKGGAGVLKGRKLSFDAKPGDKDKISPREAAAQFLDSAEF